MAFKETLRPPPKDSVLVRINEPFTISPSLNSVEEVSMPADLGSLAIGDSESLVIERIPFKIQEIGHGHISIMGTRVATRQNLIDLGLASPVSPHPPLETAVFANGQWLPAGHIYIPLEVYAEVEGINDIDIANTLQFQIIVGNQRFTSDVDRFDLQRSLGKGETEILYFPGNQWADEYGENRRLTIPFSRNSFRELSFLFTLSAETPSPTPLPQPVRG